MHLQDNLKKITYKNNKLQTLLPWNNFDFGYLKPEWTTVRDSINASATFQKPHLHNIIIIKKKRTIKQTVYSSLKWVAIFVALKILSLKDIHIYVSLSYKNWI